MMRAGAGRIVVLYIEAVDFRQLTFRRPGLLAAQKVADRLGFQLVYSRVTNIPEAELYRPMFQPWRSSDWNSKLNLGDDRSLLTPEARYYFYSLAADAKASSCGSAAECGVYRGGTAKMLSRLFSDRELLLFDTFEGMPETDPDKDLHRKGDFADTSLESVKGYVGAAENVRFVAGFIPETLAPFSDRTFCFVHVDLDIYPSIRSACDFFYPRLAHGGIMLFDDYGFASCPGARRAVDEFFSDKTEIPMVLPTGQCLVRCNR
jgi:O-methyltransferase